MALPSLSASEVEEGEDAAALILKHGAVVVRGVVSLATCVETRARIDERLRLANLEAFGEESTTAEFSAAGRKPEQVDAAARYFGNVTAPVHRRDLKLALNEEVGSDAWWKCVDKANYQNSAHLSEEERQIRDAANEFAQGELAPLILEWNRTETFDPEIMKEMGKLGFLGATLPDYGPAMGGTIT